jgi:hypothetical protein
MSTTGTSTTSIRSLPPRDQTTTPQIRDDVFELRARSAEVRDQATTLVNEAEVLHDRVQEFDLDDRASALAQNDPAVLLSALGDDRGMPWSLVAQLVGVSPTAVRKWRRGGALTPESRSRLAKLVAFCQVLPELDPLIGDVALWLQSPVISGATTITPADLFARGSEVALLNRAAKRITAEQLLEAEVPNWRATTRPDNRHRVVEAPDGIMSIVPAE